MTTTAPARRLHRRRLAWVLADPGQRP